VKLFRFLALETKAVLMIILLVKEAPAQPNICTGLAFMGASFVIAYIMILYAIYFDVCGAHDHTTGETSNDCA